MYNPLEQFKTRLVLDFSFKYIDFSLTMVYLIISIVLIIIILLFKYFLSKELSKIYILIIQFINLLNEQFINILGIRNASYLPFIIFSFFYILICNVLGLIPYSFTLTAQIIVTFLWSTTIMITVTYIGIKKHNISFINLFIPKGVPIFLVPFIAIIELISYLSRVLSLAIRLSTNMVAGHTLIFIISWFGFKFSNFIKISIIIPVLILILTLELGVSIIQAYVLVLLMATYIKDSIELH